MPIHSSVCLTTASRALAAISCFDTPALRRGRTSVCANTAQREAMGYLRVEAKARSLISAGFAPIINAIVSMKPPVPLRKWHSYAALIHLKDMLHFCILSSQFDNRIGIGNSFSDRMGSGDHLLLKRNSKNLRHANTSRPRDGERAFYVLSHFPSKIRKQRLKRRYDVRSMTTIARVDNRIISTKHHDFDGL